MPKLYSIFLFALGSFGLMGEPFDLSPIAAGDGYSLVINKKGAIEFFGAHQFNQGKVCLTPTEIKFMTGKQTVAFIQVSAGSDAALALDEDGGVYEALGENRLLFKKASLPPEIIQIACGQHHQVALSRQGIAYIRGTLFYKKNLSFFTQIKGIDEKIDSIAAGLTTVFLVTKSGLVYSLGRGENGQLGGYKGERTEPRLVKGLKKIPITRIASGAFHTLALSKNGEVYGFGYQNSLGLKRKNEAPWKPIKIALPERVIDISAGYNHSLAVTESGKLYAFGSGYGLGLSKNCSYDIFPPTEIVFPTPIMQASAGDIHSLLRDKEGGVFAWGAGILGRLGLGDQENYLLPKKIECLVARKKSIMWSTENHHLQSASTKKIIETMLLIKKLKNICPKPILLEIFKALTT